MIHREQLRNASPKQRVLILEEEEKSKIFERLHQEADQKKKKLQRLVIGGFYTLKRDQ